MKKLLKTKLTFLLSSALILSSCNKEGQGGLGTISGNVMGTDYQPARSEITEVIISDGNTLEHGDYWLLNSTTTDAYYYIWYDNPTWISNGDPMLAGRTGIPVTFNYSDSNVDVATNTVNALNANTNEFSISIAVDIITIINIAPGYVPDADKVISPFEINTPQQGKNKVVLEESALINERVYLIYGDGTAYDDDVNTGADGTFEFNGLTKGDYSIYLFSLDTTTNKEVPVYFDATISSKKDQVDLGTISLVK